ncbi:MAG: endonuclease/exonuclease/phosphatase family protein [Planctomycetes bacterium]|nr:endonuclease/exonuclease/phosphatase family protein [Planctomycetota bacterium]
MATQRLVVTAALVVVALHASTSRSGRAAILPSPVGLDAPRAGDDDGLRLRTLNVFALPWPLAPAAESRCARIADSLRDGGVDVLALQEVWTEAAAAAFARIGYHRACPAGETGLVGGTGLLTLSLHPVRSAELRHFSAAAGVERVVAKGALRTVIALPDRDLDVWNLHLQSGVADGPVRGRQIDELLGWLAEHATVPFAAVVGDFNCAPGDPEFVCLRDGLAALGFRHAPCGLPTYDHVSNPLAEVQPPAEIDHVFVRVEAPLHGDRVHDAPDPVGPVSDHYGVEIVLPRR